MASCGPENTDHRWYCAAALAIVLSCRHCSGVWNPPPEIRAWVLLADALKVELERAQAGYSESIKTLDVAVKRVVELERRAPCRGCGTPIQRMFPAQCIECAQ